MSASRDDILAELRLTPRWVLRCTRPQASVPPSGPPAPPAEGPAPSIGSPAMPPAPALRPAVQAVASPVVPARAPAPTGIDAATAEDRRARIATLGWSDFAADVAACTACKLCRTRNKVVPGVGDPNADWLFVGEAPGAEEDSRGEPFVGQAGRLLDNMLAALGLARTRQVYIANVLKCRPPNNRAPEPMEADACSPYLARQIDLIEPKVVVALGKTAASLLLATDASVASLRGRVHRYRDVPLVVTYHPAYLLRSLSDKAKTWEDLVLARATIERSGGEVSS